MGPSLPSALWGQECRAGGPTCDDLDGVVVLLDEAAHRQPELLVLPVLQVGGAPHTRHALRARGSAVPGLHRGSVLHSYFSGSYSVRCTELVREQVEQGGTCETLAEVRREWGWKGGMVLTLQFRP